MEPHREYDDGYLVRKTLATDFIPEPVDVTTHSLVVFLNFELQVLCLTVPEIFQFSES